MRAYWAVFGARFRTLLQYRAAALAGFLTQTFFGLFRIMVFEAFYASSATPAPLTIEQVVSYIWLGQALFMLVVLRVDQDVANMVRTGDVAYELLRPVRLYPFWFCRAFALRTAPLTLRALPMIAVAIPFFGMRPPADWQTAGLFAISLLCAMVLCASITVFLSISLIWTISGRGIDHIVRSAAWVFSGIVIPLPLFPDWAQPILNLLPFRGLMDVPFRIYIGQMAYDQALLNIGTQMLWCIVLVGSGWAALNATMSKIQVQGG